MNVTHRLVPVFLILSMTTIQHPVLADDFGVNNKDPLVAERNAIINALANSEPMQNLSRQWNNQPIKFSSFRDSVINSWAWVQAEPATADDKQHFDPISGVMHRVEGKWKVVELVGDDVAASQNPEKAFKDWCARFEEKHHSCPDDIFPSKL